VRATFDSSLYQDGGGDPWSSSTGSVANMVLKPAYYGQQSDGFLIKATRCSSCWVAPLSSVSGTVLAPFNTAEQYWDNSAAPNAFLRWGYTTSVTARSVGLCQYAGSSSWNSNGAMVTLKGFTSNAYAGGTTLLSIAGNTMGQSQDGNNYSWHKLTATGSFSHYEISASAKHDHYTWPPILAAF
jgi:hypothetical protein